MYCTKRAGIFFHVHNRLTSPWTARCVANDVGSGPSKNESGDCRPRDRSPLEMVFHNSCWRGRGEEWFFCGVRLAASRALEKYKGCDIGYALAISSCEGASSVETCTVTAFRCDRRFRGPKPQLPLAEPSVFSGLAARRVNPFELITQPTSDWQNVI